MSEPNFFRTTIVDGAPAARFTKRFAEFLAAGEALTDLESVPRA